jgi:hypothetical protein
MPLPQESGKYNSKNGPSCALFRGRAAKLENLPPALTAAHPTSGPEGWDELPLDSVVPENPLKHPTFPRVPS